MYSKFCKIAARCLMLILFFPLASWSSEGGGHESAPAAKEADGGGHGSAEPAPPKKRTREESYIAVSGKVAALEAKIRSGEQEIQKLVATKATTSNPQQVNEIIKSMLTLHYELKKNIEEYEKQRSLLRYRYPEKAKTEGREYERLELKSLEEMEGTAGLNIAVRKTLQKMRSQYSGPNGSARHDDGAASVDEHERHPASSEKSNLLEPVILKK
jgi:hypothetical protein